MKSLGRQILDSLLFSLVLSAIIFGMQQIEMKKSLIHPQIWSIMIFSAILGIIVVAIAHWALSAFEPDTRPNLFIGITVLRMLLSMIFLGAVIFIGLEERVLWVVNFFVVYLFYLVFEIYTILSNLRAISGEGEN
ncbi:MAG TPA: hypothetical protein VIN11_07785 [Roseivirga sp.]